jgi:subtilisin family serine protease
MRKRGVATIVLLFVLGALLPLTGGLASAGSRSYVVVYTRGVTLAQARAAVAAAGGAIVKENREVGVATAISSRTDFVSRALRQPALFGATLNRAVGSATAMSGPEWLKAEQLTPAEKREAVSHSAKTQTATAEGAEPLANVQWDMQMLHATVDGSYGVQPGDPRVLVGVIDTGIDGSHPDLAPNFNASLSRNFTTDIPVDPGGTPLDGPCEYASCKDPADVDNNGHGSHVAGIIAASLNGLGTAGVAPNVTLVNVRAGQDSGFFFLQETVDALTYAGDIGIDVVNMSYYTDPWLFNCADNPADSAEEQAQQRTIIEASQRALDYAYKRNVTLVAAAGNDATDLGNPTHDESSPDYPQGTAHPREVNNSCVDVPAELNHVIAVSSLGPSGNKSDFSNYGVEQIDVSAPGGWFRDFFGTPQNRVVENTILSTMPENVAIAEGDLNPDGTPNTPFVVQDCDGDTCAYYQWLQGTSMAAPHAVGVVALIISEFGTKDGKHKGGLTLNPVQVEKILYRSAQDHACPDPRLVSYTNVGRPASWDAYCEGGLDYNGFYGNGIVDALNAVDGNRGNDQ